MTRSMRLWEPDSCVVSREAHATGSTTYEHAKAIASAARSASWGASGRADSVRLSALAARHGASTAHVLLVMRDALGTNARSKARTAEAPRNSQSSNWLCASPMAVGENTKPTMLLRSIGHQNAIPSVASTMILRSPLPMLPA